MAVDFSGKWLCTDIVGDMNECMTKAGQGWPVRTAAKGMGYGRARQTQDISQCVHDRDCRQVHKN